jgi:CRISPR-associated protein Csh2
MKRGVTWYDSASKAGCENEMLVWVQLKEGSKIVLPNFICLIDLLQEKEDGKCVYDFSKLKEKLHEFSDNIETIEVYYDKQTTTLQNLPENAIQKDI